MDTEGALIGATDMLGVEGTDTEGGGIEMSDWFAYWNKNIRQRPGYIPTHPKFWTDTYDKYKSWQDDLHGGSRYASYLIPIFGQFKFFEDNFRYVEDYYNNTGEDAIYGRKYGSYGGTTFGGGNPTGSIVRMSRSLAHLYPAEVMENVIRARRDMYRAGRDMADHWKSAWQEYNRRFD